MFTNMPEYRNKNNEPSNTYPSSIIMANLKYVKNDLKKKKSK